MKNFLPPSFFRLSSIIFLLTASLAPQAEAQRRAARAIPVLVDVVSQGQDAISRRSIAHIEAINSVDVNTLVENYLEKIYPQDGDIVKKGDILFEIDKTRYQATVDKVQASIQELDAQIAYAKSRHERSVVLNKMQALSTEDRESAMTKYLTLQAQKSEQQALLVQAVKNLEDCTIRAKIDGRLGRIASSPGNYIKKGETLATIKQMDPIYARFPLSQSDVRGIFGGAHQIADKVDVILRSPDGLEYPEKGKIIIVDNQLNSTTDTYTLWAEFKNPDGKLTPQGIAILEVKRKDSPVVSMVMLTAIHYDEAGAYCYTVNEKNIAQQRRITVGGVQGSMQSVYTGLRKGECVIIDGAHKIRRGDIVKPVMSRKKKQMTSSSATRISTQEAAVQVETALVIFHKDETVLSSDGARVESIHSVDISPQVQGILSMQNFIEGSFIEEGSTLFHIDSTRYQATLDAEKARLRQVQVRLDDAKVKLDRHKRLLARKAASQDDVESAQASYDQHRAQKNAIEAIICIAQDDLERCNLRAPMKGRIGRSLVTQGNYITDSSPIAQIVQRSPIYVRFSLSERDILSTFGNAQNMREQAEITLISSDAIELTDLGRCAFVDNTIQSSTSTQNCWAIFTNEQDVITPGAVVRIELRRSAKYPVLSVPDKAILTNNKGYYVYIIKDGKAAKRSIIRGASSADGRSSVFSGLHEGERVIIDKLFALENGTPVRATAPKDAQAATKPSALK